MFHCSQERTGVLLSTPMARLVHHTRHVLPRIGYVTGGLAAPQRRLCGLHAGLELALAVEGRNDHVTPLVPVRVIAIMTHDEAANAVIVRINLGHYSSIRTASPSPAPAYRRDWRAAECLLFDVSGLRVHLRQEVPDRLLVVDHDEGPTVR